MGEEEKSSPSSGIRTNNLQSFCSRGECSSGVPQPLPIQILTLAFFQIKRFSKSPVYVKNTLEENAVSNDILKLPNGLLELEKPFKLFDMKKFQQNVNREMKRTYPDRRKLESQCISAIAFVRNEPELLDSPIWIMLINIVALEMLRVKLPAGKDPKDQSFVAFLTYRSFTPVIAFYPLNSSSIMHNMVGRGCGAVGRAVASDTRNLRFES